MTAPADRSRRLLGGEAARPGASLPATTAALPPPRRGTRAQARRKHARDILREVEWVRRLLIQAAYEVDGMDGVFSTKPEIARQHVMIALAHLEEITDTAETLAASWPRYGEPPR
jgi:hypothetical protein